MKFWDTIAKMCGVKVTKIQPGIWTTNDHGIAARESPITGGVAVRFGGLRVRVDELGSHRSRVTVGDRTWELTDTTEASAVNTPRRIGLIAIERIRPMVVKSGRINTDFVGSVLMDAHKDASNLPS